MEGDSEMSWDASEPRLDEELCSADNVMAAMNCSMNCSMNDIASTTNTFLVSSPEKQKTIFDYAIPTALAERAANYDPVAPRIPFTMLPNHFFSNRSLKEIVDSISQLLKVHSRNVDFGFVLHECAFHGLFEGIVTYTDFHIRIYQNPQGGFIIEIQKLDYETKSFHLIYIINEIKTLLSSTVDIPLMGDNDDF